MTSLPRLVAGTASLTLAPQAGGAIAAWQADGIALFRPPAPNAATARDMGCYPLVPFSNRVAHRRFTHAGRTHTLPALMRGWAIHGAGWQRPWTCEAQADRAVMALDFTPEGATPLWPFAFRAEQRIQLAPRRLTIRLRIENTDRTAWPAGFGLHPFFPRHGGAVLAFAASQVGRTGLDLIPEATIPVPPHWNHAAGRAVGSVALDHCFAGWDGVAHIAWPRLGRSLAIAAEATLGHLVVYTPPGQDFFAVEPVSHANDALNHPAPESGLFVLEAGDAREATVTFSLEAP